MTDKKLSNFHLPEWNRKLLDATEKGDIRRVRTLIDNDDCGDLDVAAIDGSNALLNATAFGSIALVQTLVSANADVNYTDHQKFGAITVACYLGHLDIVKYLIELPQYKQPETGHIPLLAAASGHLNVLEYLIEKCQFNINEKGEKGYTAIMMAAECGQSECVKYLASQGADLNIRNDQGYTVFDILPRTLPLDNDTTTLVAESLVSENLTRQVDKADILRAIRKGQREYFLKQEGYEGGTSAFEACFGPRVQLKRRPTIDSTTNISNDENNSNTTTTTTTIESPIIKEARKEKRPNSCQRSCKFFWQ